MQTQPRQAGQVAHVTGCPRVARQVGKSRIGCAQRIVTQWMPGQGLGLLLTAALAKKCAQWLATFFGQHPALHLRLVIDLREVKKVEHRTRRAGFGLGGAIHHARQAGVHHGAAAHGARLQRHVQRAPIEPVVAQPLRRRPQRDDLGMGRGVVVLQRCIAASGDHLAIFDHHGAHRDFTRARRQLRLREGKAHPLHIRVQTHHYDIYSCQRLFIKRYRPF